MAKMHCPQLFSPPLLSLALHVCLVQSHYYSYSEYYICITASAIGGESYVYMSTDCCKTLFVAASQGNTFTKKICQFLCKNNLSGKVRAYV